MKWENGDMYMWQNRSRKVFVKLNKWIYHTPHFCYYNLDLLCVILEKTSCVFCCVFCLPQCIVQSDIAGNFFLLWGWRHNVPPSYICTTQTNDFESNDEKRRDRKSCKNKNKIKDWAILCNFCYFLCIWRQMFNFRDIKLASFQALCNKNCLSWFNLVFGTLLWGLWRRFYSKIVQLFIWIFLMKLNQFNVKGKMLKANLIKPLHSKVVCLQWF